MKILVVDKAKAEIEKLQHFVDLAESYEPITLEEMAIHQYAYLGSVKKVAEKLNGLGCNIEGRKVESSDISSIIKRRPKDELHSFIKKSYTVKANSTYAKFNGVVTRILHPTGNYLLLSNC